MPLFVYKAKKENAETVLGEVTAENLDEAIESVARLNLIPVSVEEKTSDAGERVRVLKERSLRPKELYAFTRQMASLLKSGVAILQALELLAKQSRDAYFVRVLNSIAVEVRNGRAFSSCLSDHSLIFSDLYVAMVRAGEESGRLQQLLADVAEHYRRQNEISMKVRTALTYPVFMLCVGVMTVVFVLTYVMPRIMVLFDGINTPLPWPTVVVMGLSKGLAYAWPGVLVLFFLLAIFSRSFNVGGFLKKIRNRLMFSLPGVRALAVKIDIERFSRTLSLLLESGIPILRAIEIATPTLDSDAMRQEIVLCQAKVAGGVSLGEALRESSIMPDIFAQLIAVGEETGELSGALKDIADSYDQDITETTKTMTTLIEPAMILIVGLVVGFIIFAMLMPIFQMDIFAR